jgi:hypothetical protein
MVPTQADAARGFRSPRVSFVFHLTRISDFEFSSKVVIPGPSAVPGIPTVIVETPCGVYRRSSQWNGGKQDPAEIRIKQGGPHREPPS